MILQVLGERTLTRRGSVEGLQRDQQRHRSGQLGLRLILHHDLPGIRTEEVGGVIGAFPIR